MNPVNISPTTTVPLSKFTFDSGAVIVILVIGIIFTLSILFGVVFAIYMGHTRRTRRQASREIILFKANNSLTGSPSSHVGRKKDSELSEV